MKQEPDPKGGIDMAKLVLVEDDEVLRRELKLLLETYGYTCAAPTNFTDMPEAILREEPDLVLLDLTLPGKDGFFWCANMAIMGPIQRLFCIRKDTRVIKIKNCQIFPYPAIHRVHFLP